MINFFLKRIDKNTDKQKRRGKIGNLASVLGLISNGVLFLAKFTIGILSGSVSIMADAINNLSDAASSVLTLIGFQIAAKPADSEHPYGHERFEYISGFVVSMLVTFVGLQFLRNAITKIIQPENIRLSPMLFIVLVLSILLKLWQSHMYNSLGKKIDSATLRVTGRDSLNDVITTAAVLFSAIVEWGTGWRIDGYIGLLLAIYILYGGVSMLKNFIDELMGSRPNQAELQAMEDLLNDYTTILGYHDLLVHSYGPQKKFASVHIEIDETWSLSEAHQVIDRIEEDFHQKLDVELVCHLDPVPIHSVEYQTLLRAFRKILKTIDQNLRMHDFRVDQKEIEFDLVIPKKCQYTDQEITAMVQKEAEKKIGRFDIEITFDHIYLL